MPKFRNMRERVEYAYDMLNVDIFYEGDYRYTVLDHRQNLTVEMLTVEELDNVLEKIWLDHQLQPCLS